MLSAEDERELEQTSSNAVIKPSLRRLMVFLLVGACGFMIDAGISMMLIKFAALAPALARIPAFIVASMATFAGNRRFTFAGRPAPLVKGWLIYVGSTGLGALLNYAVFCVAMNLLPPTTWSAPLAIGIGSLAGLGVNYVCASTLVFKASTLGSTN
jgi:putative flippase GtrA